jgi:hypothetical protein
MDLYIFARALFNKKLLAAGLKPNNPSLWDAQHPEESENLGKITLQEEAVNAMHDVHNHDHVLHPDKPFRRKRQSRRSRR